MGLGNRPYWRGDPQSFRGGGGFPGGGMRMGLPRPGPGVGGLLIANLVMFVLQHLIPTLTFALAAIPALWWQPWRYITFQFLHGDLFHILFNMIGLYFLGMYLERAWGTRRFLVFYLVCGVISGLTHVALTYLFHQSPNNYLIGASGGVYAVIAACAILFPNIQLILMFFPVPIRFAALLFFLIAFLSILSGDGGGISHAAHFGGMVAGGVWVWLGPRLRNARAEARQRINNGAWERKMRRQQQDQAEVDRILDKIRREGIGSLSSREKRILQDATEKQRRQDRTINRM
jgi:membrane associated rhomboid family serine protease